MGEMSSILVPSPEYASIRLFTTKSSGGCEGFFTIDISAMDLSLQRRPTLKLREPMPSVTSVCFSRDNFRFRAVGPEVVASLGLPFDCTRHPAMAVQPSTQRKYWIPLRLQRSGMYRVELELQYTDFEAFNEQTDAHIPMRRTQLLYVAEKRGRHGEIEGAQHHDPRLNLYHYNRAKTDRELKKSIASGKFRASKRFVWDQFTWASNFTFECHSKDSLWNRRPGKIRGVTPTTNCATLHNINLTSSFGSWRLAEYDTAFPTTMNYTEMLSAKKHHSHFERHDPMALYRYVPYEDRCPGGLRGFSQLSLIGAFFESQPYLREGGDLKIMFLGDSHTRVSMVHLRNFIAYPCDTVDHTVKSMGGKVCSIAVPWGNTTHRVRISYANDVLLERFLSSEFDTSDAAVVVLGMGSWALGGAGSDPTNVAKASPDYGRWSIAKYARVMRAVAIKLSRHLERSKHRNSTVVWMTIPAYPPNTRRFSKIKREQRTNPRIAIFNQVSISQFRESIPESLWPRVRVVDVFDVTFPMMHLSLDHNHFTTYPQDAVLHLLLNAMT
jgi:hypothetical protein